MTKEYGRKNSIFDESSKNSDFLLELIDKVEEKDFDIKNHENLITNDVLKELLFKAKECSSDVRNHSDIIRDNLLLMYLISKTRKNDLGITKLQKLIFLVESILSNDNLRTFSYNFYRWNYGPFSKEIYKDEEALVENDLINDSRTIQLTERGEKLLNQCEEIFEDNKIILDKVNDIIQFYDKYSLPEIKEIVYASKIVVDGESQTIDDIPKGRDLQINISKNEASDIFKINNDWENTLDILLDSEFSDSIEDAFNDSKKDSSYSHDEVFSNV